MKFKNNKIKYVLLATGIIGISAILPATLLTSCSSTSNPFGPYTVLSLDNSNEIRYNTKTGNVEFYNNGTNPILNKYKNEWVDISELKSYYLEISKQNVQNTLNDNTKLSDLVNSYKQNDWDNKTNPINLDNIKEIYRNSSFLYGVNPTDEQKQVANMLNYMSILGSVFIGVNSFAQNMINYVINSEFTQTYNNLVGENMNTIFGLASEIASNDIAKQFVLGQGISFGSGDATYHLWPSGFNATISPINTTADINSPYPYYQQGGNGTEYQNQQSIEVTNITINYQWYKSAKNGGDYVLANNVQNNLTDEQTHMLEKCGIKTLSNGYSLSLESMEFNIVADSTSYTDPIYSNLVDNVYTGLYNVIPNVQKENVSDTMDSKLEYPVNLETNGIKWRTIQSESKNNRYSIGSLGKNLYDSLKVILGNDFNNSGILKIPYYFGNNQWTSMGEDYAAYEISSLNLDYREMKYISRIFVDPYYDEDGNRYVANNQNDLPKVNYMDLWLLGAFSNDLDSKSIETGYNELKTISLNDFKTLNSTVLSKYNDLFNSGLTTYYSLIQFNSITEGFNISINDNGQITKN